MFEKREIVIDGKTWILPEYRYLDTTEPILFDLGIKWHLHDGRWVGSEWEIVDRFDCPYNDHTRLVLWNQGIREFKGKEVHHIDGDPSNDSLDNLELLTKSEHKKRHSMKESHVIIHLPSGKIYSNLHRAKMESEYSGHYLNCCYYPRKSSRKKYNEYYIDFRKGVEK